MSLLVSLIASIVTFISVAVFQGAADEVEECDYARFQGTWKIVSVEFGGKADNQDIDKYTITFDRDTMSFRKCGDVGGGDDVAAARYELSCGRGRSNTTMVPRANSIEIALHC